ncbi:MULTISPECIES: GLPGLI family protein [Pedobacter]|uniref:GLPGLI family protein n=1 Tax=Pedobacter TaxID=84567 RepID=UPI00210DB84B|nr:MULTISPECIES: GLPGLI family protein [unclassified Pedobacter]
MRKHITILITFLMGSLSAYSQQARFPKSGSILFEKKVNMYALIRNASSAAGGTDQLSEYKRSNPQFTVYESTLLFSGNRTLFTPGQTTAQHYSDLSGSQPNTILTDLAAGRFTTEKKVFEQTFLLKDTVRKINWKLTSERREIAGYECRRANAIIMDSIYVVAFYTDQIPVSGGPESFQGLPGMILGVALPHEHITWFARSVTDKDIQPSALPEPKKGKPADISSLSKALNEVFKDWGQYAQTMLKSFLL